MSHELRTPLNAIIGYTELILDGIYGETPEKALTVLKRVESNGRHLLEGALEDAALMPLVESGRGHPPRGFAASRRPQLPRGS